MTRAAIAILAAGRASRFHGCKQLARVQQRYLIESVIAACQGHGADYAIITGRYHRSLRAALPFAPCLYNPAWALGIGHSIAFAAQHFKHACSLTIVLADQVALQATDMAQLLTADQHHKIVCASYQGTIGTPARFNAELIPALQQLQGDVGAKALIKQHHYHSLELPAAAVDIDTQAALEHYLASQSPSQQ